MNTGDVFRIFLSAALLAAGVFLSYPERNLYGSPSWEELTQTCTTPDGTTVRLYVGNAGATTSFWYSVTTGAGFLSLEKQVMYAYGSPKLSAITCARNLITIFSPEQEFSFTEAELLVLRDTPRAYSQGDSDRTRNWGAAGVLKLAVSLVLALTSLCLIRAVCLRISGRRVTRGA